MYTDKTLTCRDCGASFTFSAGEQEFFASKGLTNEPSRCPSCRAARRSGRGGDYGGTGDGRSSYGDGGYERRDRQMYSVTCSDCGREAQVPFQPRGDRPVYCSDCFANHRSSGYAPSGAGRDRW